MYDNQQAQPGDGGGAPQAPEPFTTADNMMLQRLQQAQAQARQSLDDGEIEQEDYQAIAGQIQQRMGPLQQRQQAQKEQAQQQQEKEMMRQQGLLESIQQQNAKLRAAQFHERIVPVPDPLRPTRIARMFESSPNNWEQIEFPPDEAEEVDHGPDDAA